MEARPVSAIPLGTECQYEPNGTGFAACYSTIVVLFGAELNSELEHQTAQDSTGGAGKPTGARGAEVADTVGAIR
jgi:hypothetical protein